MINFLWIGKFETENEKWIHSARKLNEYELMIVDRGCLYIGDENHDYEVNENEYLIMQPCDNQHGTRNCACGFHWLHFQTDEELPCATSGIIQQWEMIIEIIKAIYMCEKSGHVRTASSMLEALLNELAYEINSNQVSDNLKKKIDSYIKWNQESVISVKSLSHEFGYHEKYLSRKFHQETGQTLKRYLMNKNLEKARNLLLNTEYSVEQIGMMCGYSDAHNFTRMIRIELGMPPSEFRNRFHQR